MIRRVLGAALATTLLVALAGCIPGAPVNAKTSTVADSIRSLGGVTDVTADSQESTYYTAPRSDVYAGLAPGATATDVATILSTFAAANRDTGTATVSSRLYLILGTSANQIDLELASLTDAQATAAADTWFRLRAEYDSAALHLAGPDELAVDVTVALGGEPSVERDLRALYDARDIVRDLAPTGEFTEVDGQFGASGGLPDDAWLTLMQSIAALIEISAQYYGYDNSLGVKADFVASDAVLQQQIAALVPAGDAVDIDFRTDAGTPVFLSTASCDRNTGLAADDPSRALLEFWASDGRALADGSTLAECFG